MLTNLTIVATEGTTGFLQAFPTGTTTTSSVTNWFGANQTHATFTTVGLNGDGSLSIKCNQARTDLVIDLIGFIA